MLEGKGASWLCCHMCMVAHHQRGNEVLSKLNLSLSPAGSRARQDWLRAIWRWTAVARMDATISGVCRDADPSLPSMAWPAIQPSEDVNRSWPRAGRARVTVVAPQRSHVGRRLETTWRTGQGHKSTNAHTLRCSSCPAADSEQEQRRRRPCGLLPLLPLQSPMETAEMASVRCCKGQ